MDSATGSLRARLAAEGYAVLPAGVESAAAAREPWALVERLLGERPVMVERQPIRPVAGGRSFASTMGDTPAHTDSQDDRGAPPCAQIMLCERPAARGGETTLIDGWALLERIERGEPDLFRALFATPRAQRFYFGVVKGPTVALRVGALAWTHSPVDQGDAVGRALAPWLREAPVIELAVRAGEALVVDNRRMLHGRRAFDDAQRCFARVLAWLERPLGTHARFTALAARHAAGGVKQRSNATGEARLRAVLAVLTGTPPSVVAAREGVEEAELYRWRSDALRAAASALE